MQLKDYINILRRRKWIVILTVLATVGVVVIGTSLIRPVYQASTTLRVAASAVDSLNSAMYTYNKQLMNTYVEIATSRPILEELAQRLELNPVPEIEAEVVPDTELIRITVKASDPKSATATANALADILIAQSDQLYTGGDKKLQEVLANQLAEAQSQLEKTRQSYGKLIVLTPPVPQSLEATRQLLQIEQNNYATLLNQYEQVRLREEIRSSMITVVEEAVPPQEPSSPRALLNYSVGLIAGLLGGLALAFIFEDLDTTLYAPEDIEATAGMNIVGQLPHANRKSLNISQDGDSPLGEAFRKLVIGLQAVEPKRQRKILLIVGPEPRQGVSMVVSNLAYAFSEYGNNVIAVDCNLRQPTLHSLFGLPNENGLVGVLEHKLDLDQTIQNGRNDCLHVLTSGGLSTRPGQLIASAPMTRLINDLRQRFDIVLMDAPAFLAVADIRAIVSQIDGLILVVRQAHVQRETLREAAKFLSGYQDKFVGLIINESEVNNSRRFYKYKRTAKLTQNEAD